VTMPPAAHELYRRVQTAAEGTPYTVRETDTGFDVTLDIVDAQWFGLLNRAGLSKVYTHHVSVPETGVYSVTDESQTVEWVAGAPRTTGSSERVIGRVKEFGFEKVWAFDEHGDFGVQAEYRFNSEEGRQLLVGVADQLGMQQRRGAAEKTGLVFAVIGGVGALVAVVVVLALALAGRL
jgi:hypothetical protein